METIPTSPSELSRREVLALSASAVALTVLGGCASESKSDGPVVKTGVINIGPARDYPAGTVTMKLLKEHGIAIVNDSGPVVALIPICTHAGCLTAWKPEINQFACPCHGSFFNTLGQPLKGPAKKPMKAIAAQAVADGTLTVDLDRLYAM